MTLFELIDIMYDGSGRYKDVSDAEKTKHCFMINRLHGIKYPIQANYFNKSKIYGPCVVDYWYQQLGNKYKSTPNWMFQKNKKQVNTKREYSCEVMNHYYKIYRCSYKDIEVARKIFPDETEEQLMEIQKLFESVSVEKDRV